jgi:hypothetical protein
MTDQIPKKDLEKILDNKFIQYQSAILKAMDSGFNAVDARFEKVDFRFNALEQRMETKFQEMERRMDIFEEKLDCLITTLDHFLKRLTDFEDEFKILKAKVDQIKTVFKEKLGIEIAIQK